MLLIGFTWIFVAMAAGILVCFVFRGRPWEDTGPAAIMVAAVGAFFGSFVAAYVFSPIGDPSSPAVGAGVICSVLGGFGAFALYVIDVRRRVGAQS
jgi:FtsH-binding integral membrane protein